MNKQTKIASNMKYHDANQLGRMTIDEIKTNMNNAKSGLKNKQSTSNIKIPIQKNLMRGFKNGQ